MKFSLKKKKTKKVAKDNVKDSFDMEKSKKVVKQDDLQHISLDQKQIDYANRLRTTYMNTEEREQNYQEYEKQGYTVDRDLSNAQRQIYVKNGQVQVFHRGSKTARDWIGSDVAILGDMTAMDPRFREAKKLHDTLKEKYGTEKKIIHAGHSLGGTIADSIAQYDPKNAHSISYNAGYSIAPRQTIHSLLKPIRNQTVIRNEKDLVSKGSNLIHFKKKEQIQTIRDIHQNPISAHMLPSLYNARIQLPNIFEG
jgi:hypothetical protein